MAEVFILFKRIFGDFDTPILIPVAAATDKDLLDVRKDALIANLSSREMREEITYQVSTSGIELLTEESDILPRQNAEVLEIVNSCITERPQLGNKLGLFAHDDALAAILYEVCDHVHASCDDTCPVYHKNGGVVDLDEDGDCACFKSGRAMLKFLKWK